MKKFIVMITLCLSTLSMATPLQLGAPLAQGEGQIVEGTVTEVCKKKGCWMKIKSAEGERTVRFKDYGFFMPKDITGRKVKLKAVSLEKLLSVKDQKHYLKDAGASDAEIKAVKNEKTETEWLASGVEILE